MCYCGNNIVGPQGGVATEEDFLMSRLKCGLVENGHLPLIELNAEVSLYPWKAVFLADGTEYVITG